MTGDDDFIGDEMETFVATMHGAVTKKNTLDQPILEFVRIVWP